MPIEAQALSAINATSSSWLLNIISNLSFLYKIAFLILFALYFIFSLIVIRQVQIMTDTLVTEVAPVLRALAIIQAGVALAVLILFIGLF